MDLYIRWVVLISQQLVYRLNIYKQWSGGAPW